MKKQQAQLKIGDVVRLKSGGPSMTVESLSEIEGVGEIVNVVWFALSYLTGADIYPNRTTFKPSLLKREEEES